MPALYPLRFQPIFRRFLWGGRRLESLLGKHIAAGNDFAESWEIVDHANDQSVVAAGSLAGATLHELVVQHGSELLGPLSLGPKAHSETFPLLFKFLDAHRHLSVQVHPNDQQAARQVPPDRGKTEAWVILHAEPDSVIYAGIKRGFDRAAFEREVRRETTELCLHRITPRVGDCFFLPAGVVHALGGGLVVAEIQQASDTTFRLFDWNRVGADGRPRALHVEQALDVIDFNHGPVNAQTPQPTERAGVERLVACDKFVWDRWKFRGQMEVVDNNEFHLLAVIDGSVSVSGDPVAEPLTKGQTILIPASMRHFSFDSPNGCTLLDAYLPS